MENMEAEKEVSVQDKNTDNQDRNDKNADNQDRNRRNTDDRDRNGDRKPRKQEDRDRNADNPHEDVWGKPFPRTEKIGSVTLDYSKYPGEDQYCDGAVEDELLQIVQTYPKEAYWEVIEERGSWPVLYHLSPLRENIIDWVPMRDTDKVLEVGSGCGAITGAIARKAGSVTCVDLSRKRSRINAHRHSTCGNVTIHVGNFKDIEPELPRDFQYICLIGVFEYGQGYIGGETPYEDFLRILLPHLARGGRILIAIENKYGMKYFAGCREDHLGGYFLGIENYKSGNQEEPCQVKTFGRNGLEAIFRRCGVPEAHFYYPYPDYKFMTTLYSDGYLPGKGELSDNLRNFDRERVILFNEKRAFDGVVEEGLFSVFANSYLAVIGAGFETKYMKYSNDRAPEYAIRTRISQDVTGRFTVWKSPVDPAAREHVRGLETAWESLAGRYGGSRLEINRCSLLEEGQGEMCARFPFVEGVPLSELMDRCLESGDVDGFHRLFQEYIDRVGYHGEYPVADFDLGFDDLLVDGDRWTLTDYEWTFGKPIETRELAFRAISRYLQADPAREKLDMGRVLQTLGITEEEAASYRQQEREFRQFVAGERLSMAQIRDRIGFQAIEPDFQEEPRQEENPFWRLQVYEDRGMGCREEASYFVADAYERDCGGEDPEGAPGNPGKKSGDSLMGCQGGRRARLELSVAGEVKTLRIDPAFGACAVKLERLEWNGETVSPEKRKLFTTNGVTTGSGQDGEGYSAIVFATEDPQMNLWVDRLPHREENTLAVSMQVVPLPLCMARDLAGAAGGIRIFRRG